MAEVNYLNKNSVPYNDFVMLTEINPEEFDANFSALSAKITEIITEHNSGYVDLSALTERVDSFITEIVGTIPMKSIGTEKLTQQAYDDLKNASRVNSVSASEITEKLFTAVQGNFKSYQEQENAKPDDAIVLQTTEGDVSVPRYIFLSSLVDYIKSTFQDKIAILCDERYNKDAVTEIITATTNDGTIYAGTQIVSKPNTVDEPEKHATLVINRNAENKLSLVTDEGTNNVLYDNVQAKRAFVVRNRTGSVLFETTPTISRDMEKSVANTPTWVEIANDFETPNDLFSQIAVTFEITSAGTTSRSYRFRAKVNDSNVVVGEVTKSESSGTYTVNIPIDLSIIADNLKENTITFTIDGDFYYSSIVKKIEYIPCKYFI